MTALTTSEWAALLIFASAMSFTPGPNTTLSTALAANGGMAAAWRFVLAVPVGWGILLTFSATGAGAVMQWHPLARTVLQVLGLLYLLYLAVKLWRTVALPAVSAVPAVPAVGEPSSGAELAGHPNWKVGFVQGVLLQFVNIKAWMNAWVVSSGWIAVGAETTQRLLWVLPVMMLYGLLSNLSYALVGAALRGWLSQGGRLQAFNRVMAAALVLTAVWMVTL